MRKKPDFSASSRGDRFIGVVTERDLIKKVIAPGLDPRAIRVREFMSETKVTCPPDTSISEAARLMGVKGIRVLPIVEDTKLMGVLSERDLILYGWWPYLR